MRTGSGKEPVLLHRHSNFGSTMRRKILWKKPPICGKIHIINQADAEVCLGFERYDRSRNMPNMVAQNATEAD